MERINQTNLFGARSPKEVRMRRLMKQQGQRKASGLNASSERKYDITANRPKEEPGLKEEGSLIVASKQVWQEIPPDHQVLFRQAFNTNVTKFPADEISLSLLVTVVNEYKSLARERVYVDDSYLLKAATGMILNILREEKITFSRSAIDALSD